MAGGLPVRPGWGDRSQLQRLAAPTSSRAVTPGMDEGLLWKATIGDHTDRYTQERAVQVVAGLAEQIESVRGVHPVSGDHCAEGHRHLAAAARRRVRQRFAEFTDHDRHHRSSENCKL